MKCKWNESLDNTNLFLIWHIKHPQKPHQHILLLPATQSYMPWSRHQPFSHSYPILSPPSFDPSPLDSTLYSPPPSFSLFHFFCISPTQSFSLISTLAFLSFPQTLFSSYSSYNNGLKICLLFFFPVLILPVALSMEREREKERGRERVRGRKRERRKTESGGEKWSKNNWEKNYFLRIW